MSTLDLISKPRRPDSVADRMTLAVCEIRERRGCIYYEELMLEFTETEIVEHLREALYRASLRMRGPWFGFSAQIAIDERIVVLMTKPKRPGAPRFGH